MNATPTADARRGDPLEPFRTWDGSTYYGRAQLKPWPFEAPVVGGYIFLAGLSGGCQILATLADATGRRDLQGATRRGRYLSLLAPTIGTALLIYDLHTPKRFYNMLRVAKATSPMSIGTWVLVGFSSFSVIAAASQAGGDLGLEGRWPPIVARIASVPAAAAGAGLATYTAALLAATSAPLWAAAPKALAVRFGSSSIATGAAALALGETDPAARRKLDAIQAGALVLEAFATVMSHDAYRRRGVDGTLESPSGLAEKVGATGLGVALPLGLLAASALLSRPPRAVSIAAGLATLAGSLILRTAILKLGSESAERPDVSFRFSAPKNLPGDRG